LYLDSVLPADEGCDFNFLWFKYIILIFAL
jgi:hypothetical protein